MVAALLLLPNIMGVSSRMSGPVVFADVGTARLSGNVLTRFVRDRGLGTKINSAVALMAVIALAVGGLAITRMAVMNEDANALYSLGVVPIQKIDQVKIDMEQTRRNVLNHAVSRTTASQTKYDTKSQRTTPRSPRI